MPDSVGWYYRPTPMTMPAKYRGDSAVGLERTPGTYLDLSAKALCHLLYLEQREKEDGLERRST